MMKILASLLFFKIEYYHGKWEAHTDAPIQWILKGGTGSRLQASFLYTNLTESNGFSVEGNISLKKTNKYKFPSKMRVIGYSDSDIQNMFLIVPKSKYNLSLFRFTDNLKKLITANDPSHQEIHSFVSKELNARQIQSFFLKRTQNKEAKSVFWYNMNHSISGTYHSFPTDLKLQGTEIDLPSYLRESRVFAVICSLSFCVHYLIWRSTNFNNLQPFSYISAMCNCYFDLIFGLFLLYTGSSWNELRSLYQSLFVMTSFMNVIPEVYLLLRIIKRDVRSRSRNKYICRVTISFMMFMFYMFLFSQLQEHPIISQLFLFSTWIPQIFISSIASIRKSLTTKYVIISTLSRLVPFAYINSKESNIFGLPREKLFVVVVIWCFIQIIIFTLQNKFGGDFFIPIRLRKTTYDYYEKKPEQDTKCLVCLEIIGNNELAVCTPCNHFFHDRCLREWCEFHQICPVCRKNLPPLPTIENTDV